MAYILDEPSIGLHQRDNDKLLHTLNNLKELGNTLIVVEHDEDTMRAADYIVDIGPGCRRTWRRGCCSRNSEDIMACETYCHRRIFVWEEEDSCSEGTKETN